MAGFPHDAILRVAAILKDGSEKYGADNWRSIDRDDHLNHAINHIFLYLNGDSTEDHLGNATCRLLFALETE